MCMQFAWVQVDHLPALEHAAQVAAQPTEAVDEQALRTATVEPCDIKPLHVAYVSMSVCPLERFHCTQVFFSVTSAAPTLQEMA